MWICSKHYPKSYENPSQFCSNPSKIDNNLFDNSFGACFWRQVAPRKVQCSSARVTTAPFAQLLKNKWSKGWLLGNSENRKGLENRPVEARSAPELSKNDCWERFWKHFFKYSESVWKMKIVDDLKRFLFFSCPDCQAVRGMLQRRYTIPRDASAT